MLWLYSHVREGLGLAAAAVGREWAGCLDGILVWLEGLELGGSGSGRRAWCRWPQEQDRRAAAAGGGAAWGQGGRCGQPRPAHGAVAVGARGGDGRRG